MGFWSGDDREDDNTYFVRVFCKNCNEDTAFDIKIGTTVSNFLKNKSCNECGCSVGWSKD